MCLHSVSTFEPAVQTANQWVAELARNPDVRDETRAYAILRSVLHALRDRLGVGDAARFASQLPTVIRGVFFEDWKPEEVGPSPGASLLEQRDVAGLSAERATRLVYDLLARRITECELTPVRNVLALPLTEPQHAG